MGHGVGAVLFLGLFGVSMAIRAPFARASKAVAVTESRKGTLEKLLLSLVALGCLGLPVLSLTPLLSFADYPVMPVVTSLGVGVMFAYLWLFYRSHLDLGKNWSVTLEIREGHVIVDHGVYRRIRHPMYAAIFLMFIGQALLIANWVAGPASLVAFALMFGLRLRPEERMMSDRFGARYDEYRRKTKRLIPGVW